MSQQAVENVNCCWVAQKKTKSTFIEFKYEIAAEHVTYGDGSVYRFKMSLLATRSSPYKQLLLGTFGSAIHCPWINLKIINSAVITIFKKKKETWEQDWPLPHGVPSTAPIPYW